MRQLQHVITRTVSFKIGTVEKTIKVLKHILNSESCLKLFLLLTEKEVKSFLA